MKILDIAFKDLLRSLRSFTAIIFMFVLPLLTTAIIYFAFGGLGSGEGETIEIPVTKVQVANLDQPGAAFGGFAAGDFLIETLQSADLAALITVTEAASEADARAAVVNGEAGVAIIIPAGFSQAAFGGEGGAVVQIYEDPTLTIGPGIVRGLVTQLVDGFSGLPISTGVIESQFEANGVTADQAILQQAVQQYSARAQAIGEEAGAATAMKIAPVTKTGQSDDMTTRLMGGVMVGMLIFYAFFTGANVAQSIIQEDEEGTLARLFTTPTPQATILGGKFVSIFLTLVVQVIVLMTLSSLIFGLDWGDPLPVAISMIALITASAGFGLLLMSFVKTSQQAGPVLGGVVTMFGMAGGLMTTGFADTMPDAFNKMTLFTPQGWTLRTWQTAMTGGALGDVLLPAGVTFALGVVMFIVGMRFFQRRFA